MDAGPKQGTEADGKAVRGRKMGRRNWEKNAGRVSESLKALKASGVGGLQAWGPRWPDGHVEPRNYESDGRFRIKDNDVSLKFWWQCYCSDSEPGASASLSLRYKH